MRALSLWSLLDSSFDKKTDSKYVEHAILAFNDSITALPNESTHLSAAGHAVASIGHGLLTIKQDPLPIYQEGVKRLQRALEINPKLSYAWMALSVVHGSIGDLSLGRNQDPQADYIEALRCAEKSTAVSPEYSTGYIMIGVSLYRMLDYKEWLFEEQTSMRKKSIASYEKAVQLNPSHNAFRIWLISQYLDLSKKIIENGNNPIEYLDRAKTAIDRAQKLEPQNKEIKFNSIYLDHLYSKYLFETKANFAPYQERSEQDIPQLINSMKIPLPEAWYLCAEINILAARIAKSKSRERRERLVAARSAAANFEKRMKSYRTLTKRQQRYLDKLKTEIKKLVL